MPTIAEILTSYITKNSQGPVTKNELCRIYEWSYITKNSQGPVTGLNTGTSSAPSYITKNSQGPVTVENNYLNET